MEKQLDVRIVDMRVDSSFDIKVTEAELYKVLKGERKMFRCIHDSFVKYLNIDSISQVIFLDTKGATE